MQEEVKGHITFFDLKDAFGSISQELIQHVLERYNILDNVKHYMESLKSNINGQVMGLKWASDRFYFKNGVFQGDPNIFLYVFNPLLEYIQSKKRYGYYLNKNTPISSTPFADGFSIITLIACTHQRMLKTSQSFLKA